MNVQYLNDQKSGKRTYAVVPIDVFEQLLRDSEMLENIKDFDIAVAEIEAGEELVPSEVADAILDGEHPIKVWRKHRNLTLDQVAKEAGITKEYLSQIENGKRNGSARVLSSIANILGLTADDII